MPVDDSRVSDERPLVSVVVPLYNERYEQRPRMRMRRLFGLAMDAIFGFSRVSLRLAVYVGTFVSLASLAVGVIGEYVGRIYDEVKRRPLYVLRDAVGFGEVEKA
jgi:hypothetical protein